MCCKIYDQADSKVILQKDCKKNICPDCQRETISNDLLLGRSSRLGREDIRYNIRKRIAWKRESLIFGKLSQWREERKIQKGICRKALSSSPNSVLFDRRWDVWDRQNDYSNKMLILSYYIVQNVWVNLRTIFWSTAALNLNANVFRCNPFIKLAQLGNYLMSSWWI